MKVNKATIIFVTLIIWAVFSIFYICVDVWRDFQITQLQQILIKGREEGAMNAYGSVGQAAIKQVQDGCKELIPLNLGKDAEGKDITVNLINAECLNEKEGEVEAQKE